MINLTTKQGKYKVKQEIPNGTERIEYDVFLNEVIIFSGKCGSFDKYIEVDCEDFIDSYWNNQNDTGIIYPYGTIRVRFTFYGDFQYTGVTTINQEIKFEKNDGLSVPALHSHTIESLNMGNGESNNVVLRVVYPEFRVYDKSSNKYGYLDMSFFPISSTSSISSIWRSGTTPSPGNNGAFEELFMNALKRIDYTQNGSHFSDELFRPKVENDDGTISYLGGTWNYAPLFMDENPIVNEHISPKIRVTKDEVLRYWKNWAPSSAQSNFEIKGVSLSMINVYTVPYVSGRSNLAVYTDIATSSDFFNDDWWETYLKNFRLLLLNSDFEFDVALDLDAENCRSVGSPGASWDVGKYILRGKAINNLDKITYIDKYGNEHNSITKNSYEIECYYTPAQHENHSGVDENYVTRMGTLQTARKVYLEGNGLIPGMVDNWTYYRGDARSYKNSEYFFLECHVKNVEKIETRSSYNSRNRIPTYKITLEIYR